jgi:hypothetical protein
MAPRKALKSGNSGCEDQATVEKAPEQSVSLRISTTPDRWLSFCLLWSDLRFQGSKLGYPGDVVVLVTGLLFLAIVVGVAGLTYDSMSGASEEDRGSPPSWY